MADALSELSMKPPIDPEAQAAVTDFLDYTEFFPSDLFRSLSLIGKLDQQYIDDAARLHELAKTYSTLPSIPQPHRPTAQSLRSDISFTLDRALRCREATHAEANRLCTVADNLYSRLVSIKAKLSSMPTPPSRDPTPPPQKDRTPQTNRSRRNDGERTPRLKLFVDTEKANTTARGQASARQKNRARRVIVPGEVMPPFDPNSPGASIESESDIELEPSPVKRPLTARSDSAPREKIGAVKTPKLKMGIPKLPKTPRVRAPGVMGTNVHSQVAGISVSNAMASLTPPPEDPQPGSEWAPWLDLTDWELHRIRKKMKKNANWQPSDIMKMRELVERGRGPDHKLLAMEKAEADGTPFIDEPPHQPTGRAQQIIAEAMTTGKRIKLATDTPKAADPASLIDPATPLEEAALLNGEGMDENKLRILQERQEMARMTNLINQYSATVEKMLGQPVIKSPAINGSDSMASPPDSTSKRASKKRKRDREGITDASSPTAGEMSQAIEDPMDEDEAIGENVYTGVSEDQIDPALMDMDAVEESSPQQEMAIDPALTADDLAKEASAAQDEASDRAPKTIKLLAQTPSTARKGGKGFSVMIPLAPPGRSEDDVEMEDSLAEGSTQSGRPRRGAQTALSKDTSTSKGKAPDAGAAAKLNSISIRLPTPGPKGPSVSAFAAAESRTPATGRRSSGRKPGVAATQAGEEALVTPAPAAAHHKTKSQDSVATAASERPPSRRSARRPSTDAHADAARVSHSASRSPAASTPPTARRPPKGPKKRAAAEHPAGAAAATGDEEERYCTCGDVSYGEMVACENGACPIEWFHLGCVGLEKRPSVRETWFCPRCRDVLGIDVRGNKLLEGFGVGAGAAEPGGGAGADAEGRDALRRGVRGRK